MPTFTDRLNAYGLRTPTGWWECTLSDVCNSNGGVIQTGPFGSQLHAYDYKDIGTPVVMPQHLGDNQISTDGIARISDEDVKRLKRHCLHRGDVVFSRRGDVTRRAFITEREEGWLCGTGCMLIRPHHPNLCNEYLAFFFSLHEVKEYITKQAVGATMPNLNTGILEAIPLFLPNLVSQRKAVQLLKSYDDLIENNTRRIAILEAMAQAIYREWFVEFRFPGYKQVKLIDSPLGNIPEGWRWVELTDHGFVGRGKSRHRPRNEPELYGGPYPFFQTGDIKEARVFLWKYSQTYSEAGLAQSKLWEPGTLCITIAANIAETAILARTACFPDSVVGFVPDVDKSDVFYVKMFLDSIKQHMQNVSRGTTQDNLSLEKLLRFQIPTPPFSQLLRFREAVTPLFDELLVLSKKNDMLRTTRDLLLPKLISGQLDVEDLDIEIDEAVPMTE